MKKVRWTGSEWQKPPMMPEQPHNPPVPPEDKHTPLRCAVEYCSNQHDLETVRLWYLMEADFLVLCANHQRAFEAMTGTLSPIPLAVLDALREWYEAESRPPVFPGPEPSPGSRLYQAAAAYFGPARPTICEMPTCGKAFTDGEPFYWTRPSDAVTVALCREHHRFVSPH